MRFRALRVKSEGPGDWLLWANERRRFDYKAVPAMEYGVKTDTLHWLRSQLLRLGTAGNLPQRCRWAVQIRTSWRP